MSSKVINTLVLMLSLALFTTLLSPTTLQAQQTQFFYTVNGESWTWVLPQTPIPPVYNSDAFGVPSVMDDPGGGDPNLYELFWSVSTGGGLLISTTNLTDAVIDFWPTTGAQFFSGTVTSPILNVYGTFYGTDLVAGGASASLTISPLAVPEPATYLTLAGCLALGAIAVARKKKKAKVQ